MFDRAAVRLRGNRAKLNFAISDYTDASVSSYLSWSLSGMGGAGDGVGRRTRVSLNLAISNYHDEGVSCVAPPGGRGEHMHLATRLRPGMRTSLPFQLQGRQPRC